VGDKKKAFPKVETPVVCELPLADLVPRGAVDDQQGDVLFRAGLQATVDFDVFAVALEPVVHFIFQVLAGNRGTKHFD